MHHHEPGWGTAPKPPVYHAAEKLAHDLGEIAGIISAHSWTLQSKLRAVRLAHSPEDRETTVVQLATAYAAYEQYLAQAVTDICEIEASIRAA